MPRPPVEVADVIRAAGDAFFDGSRKWFTWLHLKVLNAILRCRTAALGGHVDACSGCGHQAISFNSCRNRHCPKCQANARDRWLEARSQDLLPTRYVHVVFTLPHQLAPLALQNKREIYGLLFRASAETLLQVARDPRTPGRGDRLLQRAAHLESTTAASSACPLRRSRPAAWPRTTARWVDSGRHNFFLPVKFSAACSAVSSWRACSELHAAGQLGFPRRAGPSPERLRRSRPCCVRCSAPIGWSTPNVLSAAPSTRSAIWAATRIAWRSPIIGWSP